jgi:hypothetical protein
LAPPLIIAEARRTRRCGLLDRACLRAKPGGEKEAAQ